VVEQLTRTLSSSIAQNKFTNSIRSNTISLTTLQAGVGSPARVNVIPSSSEATLDCRLLPGVNAEEFLSDLKARINDKRVTVEIINTSADTGTSSPETGLYRTLRAALLKAHPDALVTPILVPYSTDSAPFRARKIPAYGFTPMILDAATVATMHSDEERVPVAEFLKGLHIYFDVLRGDY
jgi:acetylornithine deacetylase/succinyl-diaminopimelate desuccinylase-like protein